MRFSRVLRGAGLFCSFLSLSCAETREASTPRAVAPSAPVRASQVGPEVAVEEGPLELSGETGPLVRPRDPRRVGDVFVHRFERKGKPDLFLTERVEALDADEFEQRISLRVGEREESILVRRSARSDRILSVHKADKKRTRLELDAYARFLEGTEFVATENAGLVKRDEATCLVSEREDRCLRSEYRVFVNDGVATMRVAESVALSRDVFEEVVDETGTVLYRAELIEVARGPELARASASAELTHATTIREQVLRGERALTD